MRSQLGDEHVTFHAVEEVLSYGRDDSGVHFRCRTNDGMEVPIRFELYEYGIVRFIMRPNAGNTESTYPMFADRMPSREGFEVSEEGDSICLRAPEILIKVNKRPWGFAVHDGTGRLIGKADRSDVDVSMRLKILPLGFFTSKEGGAIGTVESFDLRPDEHFYGFGEKFTSLDKRGQEIVSWSVDALGAGTEKSYKNMPFFMSSKGYGMFVNTTHRIIYHMGSQSLMSYTLSISEAKLDLGEAGVSRRSATAEDRLGIRSRR